MSTILLDQTIVDAYRRREEFGFQLPDGFLKRIKLVRDVLAKNPPPPTRSPQVLIKTPERAWWHPLGDCTTIGNSDDCDLVLPSSYVSAKHAVIRSLYSTWEISDNNSQNGIFLNGNRIYHDFLTNGDILLMGDFTLIFYEEDAIADES